MALISRTLETRAGPKLSGVGVVVKDGGYGAGGLDISSNMEEKPGPNIIFEADARLLDDVLDDLQAASGL